MYTTYSVLMSVYYKETSANLKCAVDSILSQTIKTDDFVLVCDGPLSQELNSLIYSYKKGYPGLFHIIRLKKNTGLGNALNIGLKACKNELIARMDSDDISIKNRCEKQINHFNAYPDCDVLSGTVAEFINTPDNIISYKHLPETAAEIARYSKSRNPVNHPCVMYKKCKVLNTGSYQPFFLYEDYYLWIRMLMDDCVFYNMPNTLLLMRSGLDLYKRRGGAAYLKAMVRFQKYLLNSNYITKHEYLLHTLFHGIIIICPNRIRAYIYTHFLRGNNEHPS